MSTRRGAAVGALSLVDQEPTTAMVRMTSAPTGATVVQRRRRPTRAVAHVPTDFSVSCSSHLRSRIPGDCGAATVIPDGDILLWKPPGTIWGQETNPF